MRPIVKRTVFLVIIISLYIGYDKNVRSTNGEPGSLIPEKFLHFLNVELETTEARKNYLIKRQAQELGDMDLTDWDYKNRTYLSGYPKSLEYQRIK